MNWPTKLQPEDRFTQANDWCRNPGRWNSTDSDSTETEVSALVGAFVTALQPDLVIETGAAWGQTAFAIGLALHRAGQGELITYEIDQQRVEATQVRCYGLPVTVRSESSVAGLEGLVSQGDMDMVDFAWLDSLFELRALELRQMEHLLSPGGVVGIHDTAPHHPLKRILEKDGVYDRWDVLNLPTPRGVMFLQRKGDQ